MWISLFILARLCFQSLVRGQQRQTENCKFMPFPDFSLEWHIVQSYWLCHLYRQRSCWKCIESYTKASPSTPWREGKPEKRERRSKGFHGLVFNMAPLCPSSAAGVHPTTPQPQLGLLASYGWSIAHLFLPPPETPPQCGKGFFKRQETTRKKGIKKPQETI